MCAQYQDRDMCPGLKNQQRVVIMCAEVLPWRCHRSLIADAEIVRNVVVWGIMNKTTVHQYTLTTFSNIDRNKKPIQIYYQE